MKDVRFSHLHNHSQFSILQSTIQIPQLVKRAVEDDCPAVALTDTGNMMGAFHFVREVLNHNKSVKAKIAEAEAKGEVYDGKTLLPIVGV
jgi:DNA polymerase-3 subunit alpha